MTGRRDEVQTARDARAAGLRRAAELSAQLAATPGWLLVGDPARLDDPDQHNQAQLAVDLTNQLEQTWRGLIAVDAELDRLDGAQPRSIDLFLNWSAWLASVPDAASLLAGLSPDPRRLFLGAEPQLTPETAQRIVDVVAANGGRVGDGDTFVAAAGLSDDDVFDLNATATVRLDPLVDGQQIGVLLPMRLETRFRAPEGDGDPWVLRVRVYPDPVALAAPPLPPTQAEADLVATCWSRAGGDLSTDVGAAAFSSLAGAVGGARAAFLVRTVEVVPTDEGFAAVGEHPDPGGRSTGYRAALPAVLQLWGDAGAGLVQLGELHPDLAKIAEQADLGTAMADLTPDQVPELWWTSYRVALDEVGLAVEVPLPDGPHLDVLLVTGLGDEEPADVFAALAGRGSLGVVAPMSPTNTVAGAPAADLGQDPATWLAVAQGAGSGTADGLAAALSGEPLLAGVPEIGPSALDVVSPLVTALWPVLWQRLFKDVANFGLDVYGMGDWAARLLSPLGPYPALRVGDVPYGILPAVDLAAWTWRPGDPPWEQDLQPPLVRLVEAWAAAATADGTSSGADAGRLLEMLGRIPTSRETGSRLVLPLELWALLRAALGEDPRDVLQEWLASTSAVRDLGLSPLRRYQSFGYVQPTERGKVELRSLLKDFLRMPWEQLANKSQDQDPLPLLGSLVRQSLLLTQAEVSRLDADPWPTWVPPYLLPTENAGRLAQDASHGRIVADLPDYAQQRLDEQFPPDSRAQAVVRQFLDVRRAVEELIDHGEELEEGGALASAVSAVLDTASHRVDPWVTALGTRRLRRLTQRQVPRRIGAYGWVDDLSVAADPTPPTTAGLLHAPGHAQALAAAVLRDHAVHDRDPRWQITARSDLVRLAAKIGDDVRLGIHLSEALGREIERRAGDPALVLTLRRQFPARPEYAGRRVCDGQLVLAAVPASLPPALGPLDDLREVLDTYGDLLVADAVHDVVSGRAAQAAESMEAAAGLGAPPDLRLLRTRREGVSVRTTVLVALPVAEADPASPVAVADPALATFLEGELAPASAWTWTLDGASVSLSDLGLSVPDVVLIPNGSHSGLAAAALGGAPTGGTATTQRAELDRLATLLDAQRGLPELNEVNPVGGTGAAQLVGRLGALRAAAAALQADLSADPPVLVAAVRWGLPADQTAALELLSARLLAAGDPAGDATADEATLAERIRALLAPVSGLPLICVATLPPLVGTPGLDQEWLEVVAAVRPACARLEASQLRHSWPAAASAPDQLWRVPAIGSRQVIVYGPAATSAEPVGVALLDDWGETVPSPKHTTFGAFGFDAPRARAAQAVLLAVPPDEQVSLSAEALPGIVLSVREQARARMAQPDQLAAWAGGVPTSLVLVTGPAGADVVEGR